LAAVTSLRGDGQSRRAPSEGAERDDERLPAAEKGVYTAYTRTHALVAQDQDNGMAHWAADGVLNSPDHDRVFGRANMHVFIQVNFGLLESITFAD
jgi:hypothetical protein